MAYYGNVPINQGAAGLGIVPRAQKRRNALSVLAPPLALLGLGEDVVEVSEQLVSPVLDEPPAAAVVEPAVVIVPEPSPEARSMGRLLSTVGAVAGAYHGYKRNNSTGWALGWFIFGSVLPVFAIPVALAQGFAKPK